jgi:hypothetical protein
MGGSREGGNNTSDSAATANSLNLLRNQAASHLVAIAYCVARTFGEHCSHTNLEHAS